MVKKAMLSLMTKHVSVDVNMYIISQIKNNKLKKKEITQSLFAVTEIKTVLVNK